MKTKIIKSDFDKETGISTVTIATPYGNFTGSAKLHPEDLDKASNYAGCEYAEIRALIKLLKYREQIVKTKIKGLQDYEKSLKNRKDYDEKSNSNRQLRKYIYILQKERTAWQEKANSLEQKLKEGIQRRDKILKDMYNRKKNESN